MPANRVFLCHLYRSPGGTRCLSWAFGLGDAIVLRNPGGRITETAINDIALISYMGEVMGSRGACRWRWRSCITRNAAWGFSPI